MIEIVIAGASGFGRELLHYILDTQANSPEMRVKGFLDDDPEKLGTSDNLAGIAVIGNTQDHVIEARERFLISLGDPRLRKQLADRLTSRGAEFFTLKHPTAHIAETAKIGPGCIIGPFANVGSYAEVEDHVLFNLYSAAGHDAKIGSCTVFSPYAVANGESSVGSEVFLGSHAVINPRVRVGDGCKVAAGAVVYGDVPGKSLATGNPAQANPLFP